MIKNLQNKLKFIELMDEMKNIERAVLLKNWRQETNAEHSFHLAMIVISFSDDFPELNIEKCIKFALVHDIVEIYAWDTIFLVDSSEKLETKKQREKDAFIRLQKEFGDNIWNLIKEFEEKNTIEARFIYQLDKVQPLMQYVIEWWKGWHKWKFDKEKLIWKYNEIFEKDEFGLKQIVDNYFEKAEKENMFYNEK